VVLRYAPRSFGIGLLVSAMMVPLCLLLFRRRRRADRAVGPKPR
jgi:hypothetical protein